MALRLIEICRKEGKADETDFLLRDLPVIETWHDQLARDETVTRVFLKAGNAGPVLAVIGHCCLQKEEACRVVTLPGRPRSARLSTVQPPARSQVPPP